MRPEMKVQQRVHLGVNNEDHAAAAATIAAIGAT